jgi:hypothetical protein
MLPKYVKVWQYPLHWEVSDMDFPGLSCPPIKRFLRSASLLAWLRQHHYESVGGSGRLYKRKEAAA